MFKMFQVVWLTVLFVLSNNALAKEETPTSLTGATVVTAEKVIALFDELDELIIVDSRKNSDRIKGFIPDSLHLANTETNADSLAKIIATKATPVVFYCNGITCKRSYEAAQIAIKLGYSEVYWFRGGIAEWRANSFPVEK